MAGITAFGAKQSNLIAFSNDWVGVDFGPSPTSTRASRLRRNRVILIRAIFWFAAASGAASLPDRSQSASRKRIAP